MPARRLGVVLALVTLPGWGVSSAVCAGPEDEADPDDIPLVGRPSDLPFSGASGRFEVSTRAEPTTLEAETPLAFTVRVQATGPVRHPPRRPDLRQLPAFTERFHVEDPDEGSRHPDPRTWEFLYRLKPKGTDVTEIPSLPFVYFNPDIRPANRAFQVVYTDAIPLRVKPHQAVAVPLQAPASAFQLATGPGLLARQAAWRPPGAAVTTLLALAPPLLCAAWYAAWRRRYPDAARQARQRRSRAARMALEQLRAAGGLPPDQRAERAAGAVAAYLRERLDLAAAEPTPAETARHLRRKGCSAELTERAAGFFRSCDAARFLPAPPPDGPDPAAAGTQLILAVEAETCPRAHS
jgi:hypothetical protein